MQRVRSVDAQFRSHDHDHLPVVESASQMAARPTGFEGTADLQPERGSDRGRRLVERLLPQPANSRTRPISALGHSKLRAGKLTYVQAWVTKERLAADPPGTVTTLPPSPSWTYGALIPLRANVRCRLRDAGISQILSLSNTDVRRQPCASQRIHSEKSAIRPI